MDIPFLGEVFTIYTDPCQTFRWCGELSNSVTIKKSKVTMACSATVKNEWYPGGLQISLHIDLPDF